MAGVEEDCGGGVDRLKSVIGPKLEVEQFQKYRARHCLPRPIANIADTVYGTEIALSTHTGPLADVPLTRSVIVPA